MSRLKWLVGPHPPYWRQSGAHSFAILGSVCARANATLSLLSRICMFTHMHTHPHRVSSAHYLRIFDAYFINISPRCVHAAVTRRRRPFGFVARADREPPSSRSEIMARRFCQLQSTSPNRLDAKCILLINGKGLKRQQWFRTLKAMFQWREWHFRTKIQSDAAINMYVLYLQTIYVIIVSPDFNAVKDDIEDDRMKSVFRIHS
jgi:hypothetical protein